MENLTTNVSKPEAFSSTVNHTFGIIGEFELCMYSFGVIFGLPTHSYVIWLILRGSKSAIASEFFFLNLSICEIGICLEYFFLVMKLFLSGLYTLSLFLQGLIVTCRPLFQCLMCVERYLAVVYPVTFLKFKPLRYRLMCSAVVWIICLGSCFSCLVLLLLAYLDIYTWFFSIQLFIFFAIELFCCVAILKGLKQSGPGERGREREEENHMKKRAFHLILITTVSMFITYVPYIVLGISYILKFPYFNRFWFTGLICYVLVEFVHPVLYLHRAGKFSWLCPRM